MSGPAAFVRCTRGAAAAELALMLPLLTVLLFGSVEVGYYFYSEHQVIKGVRDGARFAGRQSFEAINCIGGSSIPSDVSDEIKSVTRTGQLSGGTPRVPTWTDDADVTLSVSCSTDLVNGIYSEEPGAPTITVSANVPYQSLFAGVGIITSDYQLRATQQASVMGI